MFVLFDPLVWISENVNLRTSYKFSLNSGFKVHNNNNKLKLVSSDDV